MPGKKGMKGSGGKREGAGRHLKYGEPVKRITTQVPQSKADKFKTMVAKWLKQFEKQK